MKIYFSFIWLSILIACKTTPSFDNKKFESNLGKAHWLNGHQRMFRLLWEKEDDIKAICLPFVTDDTWTFQFNHKNEICGQYRYTDDSIPLVCTSIQIDAAFLDVYKKALEKGQEMIAGDTALHKDYLTWYIRNTRGGIELFYFPRPGYNLGNWNGQSLYILLNAKDHRTIRRDICSGFDSYIILNKRILITNNQDEVPGIAALYKSLPLSHIEIQTRYYKSLRKGLFWEHHINL